MIRLRSSEDVETYERWLTQGVLVLLIKTNPTQPFYKNDHAGIWRFYFEYIDYQRISS